MRMHVDSQTQCICIFTNLIELKEVLLRLVGGSVVSKAVVTKSIRPLQHATAVHHLRPCIRHKLELAGGGGCDLTQVLQLFTNDLVQRLQCLQDHQHWLVHALITVQSISKLPLLLDLICSSCDRTNGTEGWGCAHKCTLAGQREAGVGFKSRSSQEDGNMQNDKTMP